MSMIEIDNIFELNRVSKWMDKQIVKSKSNIVAVYGDMGSGKTTLISDFCRLKGVIQTPSSPTFAIVNSYSNGDGLKINHFDFYRIKNIEEVYDFGYEEYFYSDDLCLIEWPDLIEELLPPDTLKIKITSTTEYKRKFEII